jgi:hypothetical protein
MLAFLQRPDVGERVMRWRLLLEEYGLELHYIKGENNIVTDALSRLGMVKEPITETLATEQATTLYMGDETEFDFPAEGRKKMPTLIKRRLSEKDTPYKEGD